MRKSFFNRTLLARATALFLSAFLAVGDISFAASEILSARSGKDLLRAQSIFGPLRDAAIKDEALIEYQIKCLTAREPRFVETREEDLPARVANTPVTLWFSQKRSTGPVITIPCTVNERVYYAHTRRGPDGLVIAVGKEPAPQTSRASLASFAKKAALPLPLAAKRAPGTSAPSYEEMRALVQYLKDRDIVSQEVPISEGAIEVLKTQAVPEPLLRYIEIKSIVLVTDDLGDDGILYPRSTPADIGFLNFFDLVYVDTNGMSISSQEYDDATKEEQRHYAPRYRVHITKAAHSAILSHRAPNHCIAQILIHEYLEHFANPPRGMTRHSFACKNELAYSSAEAQKRGVSDLTYFMLREAVRRGASSIPYFYQLILDYDALVDPFGTFKRVVYESLTDIERVMLGGDLPISDARQMQAWYRFKSEGQRLKVREISAIIRLRLSSDTLRQSIVDEACFTYHDNEYAHNELQYLSQTPIRLSPELFSENKLRYDEATRARIAALKTTIASLQGRRLPLREYRDSAHGPEREVHNQTIRALNADIDEASVEMAGLIAKPVIEYVVAHYMESVVPGQAFVIGMIGSGGTGKTTLNKLIYDYFVEQLGKRVAIIGADGYLYAGERFRYERRGDEGRLTHLEGPGIYDDERLVREAAHLKKGGSLTVGKDVHGGTAEGIIGPGLDVVILDGVFVGLAEEYREVVDLMMGVFNEDEFNRFARKFERDTRPKEEDESSRGDTPAHLFDDVNAKQHHEKADGIIPVIQRDADVVWAQDTEKLFLRRTRAGDVEAASDVEAVKRAARLMRDGYGDAVRAKNREGAPGDLVDLSCLPHRPSRVITVGDLHGRLDNFYRLLAREDIARDLERGLLDIVFLGDYSNYHDDYFLDKTGREAEKIKRDIGRVQLELVVEMARLKALYPEQIHILAGNHEIRWAESMIDGLMEYRRRGRDMKERGRIFYETILERYGPEMARAMQEFFAATPCFARLGIGERTYLFSHGIAIDGMSDWDSYRDFRLDNPGLEGSVRPYYNAIGRDLDPSEERTAKAAALTAFTQRSAPGISCFITGHMHLAGMGEGKRDRYGLVPVEGSADTIGTIGQSALVVDSFFDTIGYLDISVQASALSDDASSVAALHASDGSTALKTIPGAFDPSEAQPRVLTHSRAVDFSSFRNRAVREALYDVYRRALLISANGRSQDVAHMQRTTMTALEIAEGEGFTLSERKNFVTLAMLHDIGYSESDVENFRSGDVRTAHMASGERMARSLLSEVNAASAKPVYSAQDIDGICRIIAIHDNPSIKRPLPLDNKRALAFREADRVWMLDPGGIVMDLNEYEQKTGERRPVLILMNGIRRHSEERQLYPSAAEGFRQGTLYRTATGFRIALESIAETARRIENGDYGGVITEDDRASLAAIQGAVSAGQYPVISDEAAARVNETLRTRSTRATKSGEIGVESSEAATAGMVLRSLQGRAPVTAKEIAQDLSEGETTAREALRALKELGLVAASADEIPSYRLDEAVRNLSPPLAERLFRMKELSVPLNAPGALSAARAAALQILIHAVNLSLPEPSESAKTIWYLIDSGLIPESQQSIVTIINKISRESSSTEKVRILQRGEDLASEVNALASDSSAIVNVALGDPAGLESLPEGVKALVFRGELGDYRQLEGIIATLKALERRDTERLLQLYRYLTGAAYREELPPIDDPKEFARRFIMDLPRAEISDYEQLKELNERLLKLLIAA